MSKKAKYKIEQEEAEAPRQSEADSLEQIGERLLAKYGMPCGVSIQKYADRLIYGNEFMEALKEFAAEREHSRTGPAPQRVCRQCGKNESENCGPRYCDHIGATAFDPGEQSGLGKEKQ